MRMGTAYSPAHACGYGLLSLRHYFVFGKGISLKAESELHSFRIGQVTQTRERLQRGGKTRGGQGAVLGTQ